MLYQVIPIDMAVLLYWEISDGELRFARINLYNAYLQCQNRTVAGLFPPDVSISICYLHHNLCIKRDDFTIHNGCRHLEFVEWLPTLRQQLFYSSFQNPDIVSTN